MAWTPQVSPTHFLTHKSKFELLIERLQERNPQQYSKTDQWVLTGTYDEDMKAKILTLNTVDLTKNWYVEFINSDYLNILILVINRGMRRFNYGMSDIGFEVAKFFKYPGKWHLIFNGQEYNWISRQLDFLEELRKLIGKDITERDVVIEQKDNTLIVNGTSIDSLEYGFKLFRKGYRNVLGRLNEYLTRAGFITEKGSTGNWGNLMKLTLKHRLVVDFLNVRRVYNKLFNQIYNRVRSGNNIPITLLSNTKTKFSFDIGPLLAVSEYFEQSYNTKLGSQQKQTIFNTNYSDRTLEYFQQYVYQYTNLKNQTQLNWLPEEFDSEEIPELFDLMGMYLINDETFGIELLAILSFNLILIENRSQLFQNIRGIPIPGSWETYRNKLDELYLVSKELDNRT